MPDLTLKTVSASQVAALLHASPYLTPWLLWRHFKHGDKIEVAEDQRMAWGKRLQAPILEAVAQEMNLEVHPNYADDYTSNAYLKMGATLDGDIRDLNLGLGAVECKNVDWMQWRDNWTANMVPDHIEIQLQAQMMVSDFKWGVIGCLIGGNELRLYQRKPNEELQEKMGAAVAAFFKSLDDDDEPLPLGREDELPLWRQTREYPPDTPPVDLQESEATAELLAELAYWSSMKSQADKLVKAQKGRLEILAGDASEVRAWGKTAYLKRSHTKGSDVSLPMHLRQHLAGLYNTDQLREDSEKMDKAESDALFQAIAWTQTTRKPGITVRITIKNRPTEGDPPWENGDELTLHL